MSRGNAPMTSSSNDGMNSATSSANHGMDTSDIPLTSSANETQTAIADQASLPESSQLENRAYIPDSDAARMDVAHALLELSQTTYVSHVDHVVLKLRNSLLIKMIKKHKLLTSMWMH